jgi:hypothetical protein
MKKRKHSFRVSHGGCVEIKLSDCKLSGDSCWRGKKEKDLQEVWNNWKGDEKDFVSFWDKTPLHIYNFSGPRSRIDLRLN